ncbi:hypothetical protein [Microbacterium sp. No. 7]|uniref:hypothetical protein n=1 Tax=Microbacterium sp. No. 7 TaxID=1714373 RepID=UPI0012E0F056|nr:hypothetical protein [Microbacterium sp. No. 7]
MPALVILVTAALSRKPRWDAFAHRARVSAIALLASTATYAMLMPCSLCTDCDLNVSERKLLGDSTPRSIEVD